jgi:hypothetical protein
MGVPPTPTAAVNPGGRKMGAGYPMLVTFSLDPDLEVFPIEVTPVGVEGLPSVDTTTQWNVRYSTQHLSPLVKGTDGHMTAMYDPISIVSLVAMTGIPQVITEHYPTGDSICYYGAVQSAVKGPLKRGTLPTMEVKWQATFEDPSDCSEQPIVFTPGAGTHCYQLLFLAAAAACSLWSVLFGSGLI